MKARVILFYEDDARQEFIRWSMAAALVTAAHFGLVASYLLMRDTGPGGAPDAPPVIVDLAALPVAPMSEVDVAVGPQMQESQTQPEPEKQIEPEQPKMDNPVVAMPEPPKVVPKPDKKPPAPRTTAAPRSPLHTGSIAAAPAPGSTNAFPPNWVSLLFSHLLRYRQYPSSAQAARQEGVVTLAFTMDRNGRVLSRYIAHSSGVPALDAEALAMIERAQPLPAFPPEMPAATRSFSAPIKFSLR